jgi:hypothetical protein
MSAVTVVLDLEADHTNEYTNIEIKALNRNSKIDFNKYFNKPNTNYGLLQENSPKQGLKD